MTKKLNRNSLVSLLTDNKDLSTNVIVLFDDTKMQTQIAKEISDDIRLTNEFNASSGNIFRATQHRIEFGKAKLILGLKKSSNMLKVGAYKDYDVVEYNND